MSSTDLMAKDSPALTHPPNIIPQVLGLPTLGQYVASDPTANSSADWAFSLSELLWIPYRNNNPAIPSLRRSGTLNTDRLAPVLRSMTYPTFYDLRLGSR